MKTTHAELVEVEVWVMVDEDGSYEVARQADELQAQPGKACRMVKVAVSVPRPRAVVLAAAIDPEPDAAELKAA